MDKKTIARFIVFILVWVNQFLSSHGYKTIPGVDDTQVATWIALAVSAYEWIKHSWKWIQTNWVKKQPEIAKPVLQPTQVSVDVTVPAAPPSTPNPPQQ